MKGYSFLTLFIIILFSLTMTYAAAPLPIPVAQVVWIKGESLKAIMMINKEERLLKKASIIYLHDLLITDNNTIAEIVFTDNTLITFQANSKFLIDDYHFSPKEKNHSVGKSVMNLIEGGFRTITGLIAKTNPIDYKIQTPVATIGVRGTDYAIYIQNGHLYAAHYAGTPCVTSNKTTLCLDQKTKYAEVTSANESPIALTLQPEGFKTQLEITNATIGLFSSGQNGGLSNANKGGPITNFCIQ
jgi:hypothetical protein